MYVLVVPHLVRGLLDPLPVVLDPGVDSGRVGGAAALAPTHDAVDVETTWKDY